MGGGKEGSLPAPRTRHKQDRGKVALFDEGDEERRGRRREGTADRCRRRQGTRIEAKGPVVPVCARWRLLSYLRAVWPMFGGPNLAWFGASYRPPDGRFLGLSLMHVLRPSRPSAWICGRRGAFWQRSIVRLQRAERRHRSPSTPRATRHTNKVPTHLRLEQHGRSPLARDWLGRTIRSRPLRAATHPGTLCALLSPEHVPSPATAQRLDTTCLPSLDHREGALPPSGSSSQTSPWTASAAPFAHPCHPNSSPAAPSPTGTAAAKSCEPRTCAPGAPNPCLGLFRAIASLDGYTYCQYQRNPYVSAVPSSLLTHQGWVPGMEGSAAFALHPFVLFFVQPLLNADEA